MSIRRIIFWSHLAAGLTAGIFVLIMSVTGILLMYEHALPQALSDSVKIDMPAESTAMTADQLASLPNVQDAGDRGVSLSWDNREQAAVMVRAGRSGGFLMNPYTGDEIADPAEELHKYYSFMMGIHRWLGQSGENRSTARAITGAANLIFLFLVVSGIYLWLPKAWKWVFFKLNMFFRKSYPTGKARDFNWHHVFGFWALAPLFLIVVSGVMISYPWAGNLIYAAWGESPPQRGGAPPADAPTEIVDSSRLASYQEAVDAIKAYGDRDWTRVSLTLPSDPTAPSLSLQRHYGDRFLPQQRVTMTYDRATGEIGNVQTYADNTPAMKTRLFLRFIHTGERFGVIGTTIAGLASLAACFLVYTGFALSYRRLIRPLFRKKKA